MCLDSVECKALGRQQADRESITDHQSGARGDSIRPGDSAGHNWLVAVAPLSLTQALPFPPAGDSACSIPTQTLSVEVNRIVREWTIQIAKELKVLGLINIQFAVQDDIPYIIEANPRASR